MNIQCNECKHNFEMKFPPDVAGKKVKFKCKNKSCNSNIEIRVPKSGNIDKSTILTSTKHKEIISARIELVPNQLTGQMRFVLKEGIMTIGRKSENRKADIQLITDDSDISRIHCSIRTFKDPLGTLSFVLKDLKSKNGVFLNEEKLADSEELFLIDGDAIRLGNTTFLFITEHKS